MINLQDAIRYVGGHWEDNGKRQLDFLISEGLKPYHTLLDIGCGCFRAGRFFIKYLDQGNYVGVEKNEWLISAGMAIEGALTPDLQTEKLPTIICNDNFDFINFGPFNYAIAKSVFTHLTKDKIKLCCDNLLTVIEPNGYFYASIFIGDSSKNLPHPDDTRKFEYSLEEIRDLASGWDVVSMGHAGCVRQTMLKFIPKL